jgi:hypothetical protein
MMMKLTRFSKRWGSAEKIRTREREREGGGGGGERQRDREIDSERVSEIY